MEDNYTVYVDYRENKVIEYLKDKIKFETQSLEFGDFQIVNNENKIIELLIERKTISDVLSSIHDGRWSEQKHRILASESVSFVYYIIELGEEMWSNINEWDHCLQSFKYSCVPIENGISAIFNLLVVSKIPFLFSKNELMTSSILCKLYMQYNKIKKDDDVSLSYQKAFIKSSTLQVHSKKKNNFDHQSYFIYCMMGIPHVSFKTAQKLSKIFPTFLDFFNYINNNSEEEFQKLWKTTEKRKLNESVVEFIYKNFVS